MDLCQKLVLLTLYTILCSRTLSAMDIRLEKITNISYIDPHPDTQEEEFICRNTLQVNILNVKEFILGLCRPNNYLSTNTSSGIGTLPMSILNATQDYTTPVNVLYGNLSTRAPLRGEEWDGVGEDARISFPEHLIQTKDSIYFVDIRSCMRRVDRLTGEVKTLIGHCLNGSLDIPGTADMNVYGMVYFEEKDMFVFTVTNFGLYLCYNDSMSYVCRQAMEYKYVTERVAKIARMLLRGVDFDRSPNNYIWQKIRFGLNRYEFTKILDNYDNTSVKLTYDNDTLVHYASVHTDEILERDAWYKSNNTDLGRSDASIYLSSTGSVMLMIDSIDDGLYFIDTDPSDGIDEAIKFCSKHDDQRRDSISDCTFTDVIGGLWLEEQNKIIVTEKDPGMLRIVYIEDLRTTTTTTTTTTTLTSTDDKGLTTEQTQAPTTPEINIVIIVVPICIGVLILIGIILCLIAFTLRKKKQKKKTESKNESTQLNELDETKEKKRKSSDPKYPDNHINLQ